VVITKCFDPPLRVVERLAHAIPNSRQSCYSRSSNKLVQKTSVEAVTRSNCIGQAELE